MTGCIESRTRSLQRYLKAPYPKAPFTMKVQETDPILSMCSLAYSGCCRVATNWMLLHLRSLRAHTASLFDHRSQIQHHLSALREPQSTTWWQRGICLGIFYHLGEAGGQPIQARVKSISSLRPQQPLSGPSKAGWITRPLQQARLRTARLDVTTLGYVGRVETQLLRHLRGVGCPG